MNQFEKLCMGCMRQMHKNDNRCPYCHRPVKKDFPDFCLAPGTMLQERYLVGDYLDVNSEGVGYIAFDCSDDTIIYVREFLPSKFCARDHDSSNVDVILSCKDFYKNYLNKFLKLAKSIATFRDLSCVNSVCDIFEENNTAYYVTVFVPGLSLAKTIEKRGKGFSWEQTKAMFMPLLSTLEVMHSADFMHLGLSADNIVVTEENKLKLCGFSIFDIRQQNIIITPELFDGYSAPEQYVIRHKMSKNTDVYGFCACLVFALSGNCPPVATQRDVNSRILVPKEAIKEATPKVIAAIANGLKLSMDERTSSFSDLRDQINMLKDIVYEDEDQKKPAKKESSNDKIYLAAVIFLVVLIISIIVATFFIVANNNKSKTALSTQTSSETASSQSSTLQSESNQITVPDLSGVNFKDAQKAAAASGNYEVLLSEEEFNDTVVEGRIISQLPQANTRVTRGSVVAVKVSKGSKNRTLPEIKNLTISAASNKVTAAGLVPKKEEAYSETVSTGLVIEYKNHNSGDILEYGTEVIIIISKGKEVE